MKTIIYGDNYTQIEIEHYPDSLSVKIKITVKRDDFDEDGKILGMVLESESKLTVNKSELKALLKSL
jgi:hypothetical protein